MKVIELNYACHIEEIGNSIFIPESLNSSMSNYDNMLIAKLKFPFNKTISQICENVNDTESQIFNGINIKKKKFSYEKELIDIDEDKEIKKVSNFKLQNDNSNLEFNINIDNNPTNQNPSYDIYENKFNNFKEEFLINFNEIQSIFHNKTLFFVPHENQNNCPLNKNKKQIFAIHKGTKKKNPYFNINKVKKEEKKENDNAFILINDKEKDENNETNFIGKKRKRNIFRAKFEIFNPRDYDDFSKRMIDEAFNDNSKLGLIDSKVFANLLKTKKYDPYNIRKKVKSGFHKILKNILNAKLEIAGSKLFFEYLPQVFITNISKKENKNILNLTLEEILSKNFCLGKDVKSSSIMDKYYHNLKVLKYLENNKEISKKANFNNIKDMKYYEVFNEYSNSKEFEKEILRLHKKENDIYIKRYINRAIHLIDFFNN